jgi:hypothetical protein
MKVAILIGVSEYQTLANLPACRADVGMMTNLLRATAEYEELLRISENTQGVTVKDQVSAFIENIRRKGQETDEVFFYYTGHGDFYNDEFYYLLSDFDKSRRKQTSLENTEIDSWLRSISPKLAVKVVDACHAGITYIKDDLALEGYLRKSQGNFEYCYFLFSSRLDQASFQDEDFSFFTRSFLQAIYNYPAQEIRYKNIIDHISDDFSALTAQTPLFVTQAHHTEVFCSITEDVKGVFTTDEGKTLIPVATSAEEAFPESTQILTERLSLVEIVKQDAQAYCAEDEAMALFNEMRDRIEGFDYSAEARDLYEITHSFKSYLDSLPKEEVIGSWLDKRNEELFAAVEDEYVKDTRLGIQLAAWQPERRVITGFSITADCPFKTVSIEAEPRYLNIPWGNCTVVFLFSKVNIYFFYFYTHYREKSWKSRELVEDFKWKVLERKLRDKEGVWSALENIQRGFTDFMLNKVRERFGLGEEGSDDAA